MINYRNLEGLGRLQYDDDDDDDDDEEEEDDNEDKKTISVAS